MLFYLPSIEAKSLPGSWWVTTYHFLDYIFTFICAFKCKGGYMTILQLHGASIPPWTAIIIIERTRI